MDIKVELRVAAVRTGRCAARSVAVAGLLASLLSSAWSWTFADGARAHPPMHGQGPAASDVIFSTRSQRPDAPAQAQAFEATRIEWVYSLNRKYNDQLKTVAPWLGAAIGATWKVSDPSAYAKDFDGQTIVHPRMKAWGGQWLTTTHPVARRALIDAAVKAVEAGADSIQVDDPLMQWYAATLWGGDFNQSTLSGFQGYLDRHADRQRLARAGLDGKVGDYRQWLTREHGIRSADDYRKRWRDLPSTPIWLDYIQATVADFYVELRCELDQRAGRPVPLSMNLTFLDAPDVTNRHYFLGALADYAISETPVSDELDLVLRAATHRALGLGWVPSIKPADRARNRAAIALIYALGGVPLVPWDTYVGNQADGQPARFYGSEGDYADLYRFARAQREHLDGHEAVALLGIKVAVDRYDAARVRALASRLWQSQIPFAFLPTGPGAPLAQPPAVPQTIVALDPRPQSIARPVSGQVPDVDAAQIDALRPFVLAPGAGRVHIVPRARPDDPDTLVLHVVDPSRAEPGGADSSCTRRIGVRRSLLGAFRKARVDRVSLGGDTDASVDARDARHLFISTRGCALWEQIVLHLER